MATRPRNIDSGPNFHFFFDVLSAARMRKRRFVTKIVTTILDLPDPCEPNWSRSFGGNQSLTLAARFTLGFGTYEIHKTYAVRQLGTRKLFHLFCSIAVFGCGKKFLGDRRIRFNFKLGGTFRRLKSCLPTRRIYMYVHNR